MKQQLEKLTDQLRNSRSLQKLFIYDKSFRNYFTEESEKFMGTLIEQSGFCQYYTFIENYSYYKYFILKLKRLYIYKDRVTHFFIDRNIKNHLQSFYDINKTTNQDIDYTVYYDSQFSSELKYLINSIGQGKFIFLPFLKSDIISKKETNLKQLRKPEDNVTLYLHLTYDIFVLLQESMGLSFISPFYYKDQYVFLDNSVIYQPNEIIVINCHFIDKKEKTKREENLYIKKE